jgi:hypothetical protein
MVSDVINLIILSYLSSYFEFRFYLGKSSGSGCVNAFVFHKNERNSKVAGRSACLSNLGLLCLCVPYCDPS